MITKTLIENFRETVKPVVSQLLFGVNYEGMGTLDCEEFERDFDEILDLSLAGYEQKVNNAEKAVSSYRWIPCENDLPDIGMTVLFCDIDGDEFIGHRALHCWWSVDEKVKNVIAWMPLPEPYKPNNK